MQPVGDPKRRVPPDLRPSWMRNSSHYTLDLRSQAMPSAFSTSYMFSKMSKGGAPSGQRVLLEAQVLVVVVGCRILLVTFAMALR